MKPAPFTHHAPRSVAEATAVLGEVGQDGKILAGGQSLIPILNMRLASPAHLVDINGVADLAGVEVDDSWVRVGALVRHADLERHEAAYAALPLLRQALVHVAHPAIRNRGTTVGSIAHADAAGEMPAILALAEGIAEVAGPAGAREVEATELFLGAMETSLEADELLTAVRFRRFGPDTGTAFAERARRHGDYALAGVAAAVTLTRAAVASARLSFVSLTDTPSVLDVTEVVQGMEAAGASGTDWGAVEAAVRAHVDPHDDIHASAQYRCMLAVELAKQTLAAAAANVLAARARDEEGPAA